LHMFLPYGIFSIRCMCSCSTKRLDEYVLDYCRVCLLILVNLSPCSVRAVPYANLVVPIS